MPQFKAHVIITGKIQCLTGLHIGGTEEGYEIGGMDNPVIKDKITGYPYIPGSSLKGKMRSMMEWTLGKIEPDGKVHGRSCTDPKCEVCRIFGASADRKENEANSAGPTRLIVRDAYPSEETREKYVKGGVFTTEIKTENSLNRITSEANPRPMERVPQGAQFDFEMVYGIYDLGDGGAIDIENLQQVYTALSLLEAGVLGGGGSRGSGKIALENLKATIKTFADYQAQAAGQEVQYVTVEGNVGREVMIRIREKLGMSGNGGQAS
jgi:CRISPR-associated protein Csm3